MLPPARPITPTSYEHAERVLCEVVLRQWKRRAVLDTAGRLAVWAMMVQGSVMVGWLMWEAEKMAVQWVLTVGGFR